MTERNPSDDDQILSAFIDSALSPQAEQALRLRLEREPALARRLAVLRRADAALREAYDPVLEAPLPERVLELLRHDTEASATAHAAAQAVPPRRVVELRQRPARPSVFTLPAALAASITLVAGFAIGFLALPRHDVPAVFAFLPAGGTVEAPSPLHEVLQSVPSGASRAWAGGVSATPRLTFRTVDGTHCRTLDLQAADGTLETLACLREGHWRLELLGFAPPPAPGDGLYRPASGPPGEHLDLAIDAIIDGPPLAAEAERQLIARGWAAEPR